MFNQNEQNNIPSSEGMFPEELKNKIINLTYLKNWVSCFTEEELNIIKNIIKHFDENMSLMEFKDCVKNNITNKPKCLACDKDIIFNRRYAIFCSDCKMSDVAKRYRYNKVKDTVERLYNCSNIFQSVTIKEKIKNKMLLSLGVEHYSQSEEFKSKVKETWKNKTEEEMLLLKEKTEKTSLEHFGTKYHLQNKNQLEKLKLKNIEQYGKEWFMSTNEFKNKSKQTSIIKYGTEHPLQNQTILYKQIQTNLKTKGVENVSQMNDHNEKCIATSLLKNGTEHHLQNPEILDKQKETNKLLYGVENQFQIPSFISQQKVKKKERYWDTFVKMLELKNVNPLFTKENYIEYDYEQTSKKYHCDKCGKDFESVTLDVQRVFCPHCIFRSKYEYDILLWLENELNIENVYTNKRFGKHELDLYIPELNFGIEFHGLYWHSDINKAKKYHRDKYLFFKEQGIELIQIFENEWVKKEYIVKSIIKNKLGKANNVVQARKCEVKEISNKEYREFIDLYHIQGYSNGAIKVGLFYNNELLSLISLSKPRYNKNYEYELIRSCTKADTVIKGGFERMFKYFITKYQPKSIITYSDVRYFNGKSYLKNGFREKHLADPDYFYFKFPDMILYHRSRFQKHKLIKVLEIFDENKTEYENMVDNKFYRIFDAGNLVFEWISPE